MATITFKTKEDAPGYTRAASPATSCSTCEHFQMKWCTEYDFDANPASTCDSWQRKVTDARSPWPRPIPPAEQFPMVGAAMKETRGEGTLLAFKQANGVYRCC